MSNAPINIAALVKELMPASFGPHGSPAEIELERILRQELQPEAVETLLDNIYQFKLLAIEAVEAYGERMEDVAEYLDLSPVEELITTSGIIDGNTYIWE